MKTFQFLGYFAPPAGIPPLRVKAIAERKNFAAQASLVNAPPRYIAATSEVILTWSAEASRRSTSRRTGS